VKLVRPLLIFDLEATGLQIERARIIEFACIRLLPSGKRASFETMVNPEEPIPPEVQKITGITDYDVAAAPAFRDIVDRLETLLDNADVAGYNASNFDVPLLRAEFGRMGRALPGPYDRAVLDSLEILRKHEVRNLTWAHKFYFGTSIPDAHRALADVEATELILFEQARRYGLEGTATEVMAALRHPFLDSRRKLRIENDEVVLCFGKFTGKSLRQIHSEESTYLDWMIETLDPEISDIVRLERDKLAIASTPAAVPPRIDPSRRRIG
jgi:DNA polymerase-3 subunit epsilon